MLLLDYNRHAIPLDRLSCSSHEERRAYQHWLSKRMRIDPDEVRLPDLIVAPSDEAQRRTRAEAAERSEAAGFLETVEFTAIDFLSDEPERDAEIKARFGEQVAWLVGHDREQNVRKAFRSFPLHELPLAQRTINPYVFYDRYLSRGRIVFFPFIVAAGLFKSAVIAVRGIYKGVLEVLDPRVTQDREVPADTYWAALRKIHRMRKPAFIGSLRLAARFDVEYLGLPLPTAPETIAAESLMEKDLDFIGASRQDRIIAEQTRRNHLRRLEWINRWLVRFDWSFDRLPSYLAREIPYLSDRGGEALWALVAAWVLDHDDVATLSFSIEAPDGPHGIRREPRTPTSRRFPPASRTRWSTSGGSGIRSTGPAANGPSFSTCHASRPTTRPLESGSPGCSDAIAGWSAAGSGWCWGRGATIPGTKSGGGCTTFCSRPTSGATRSWSSARADAHHARRPAQLRAGLDPGGLQPGRGRGRAAVFEGRVRRTAAGAGRRSARRLVGPEHGEPTDARRRIVTRTIKAGRSGASTSRSLAERISGQEPLLDINDKCRFGS